VSCVGSWDNRKGARDWPAIMRTVLREVPKARFNFLGVGVPPENVRAALEDIGTSGAVSVVSQFSSEDLPRLLASTTVGALPSYIEGFPLAVLELLAAGIPCVTYDNPGARAASAPMPDDYRIECGDTAAFARQISRVLTLDGGSYRAVAEAGRAFAEQHTWTHAASVTLACYEAGLSHLGRTTT
jgi:glycosyltransferase involved in cell wall biosynthesis